jgi:transposase
MNETGTPHSTAMLLMAMEMSNSEWLVKSTDLKGERSTKVKAGDIAGLVSEIGRAQARFRLSAEAPVHLCHEAGRDGFWVARHLQDRGVHVVVMDPASIEMPRHKRRAKTDRLDVDKLLVVLKRLVVGGETKCCRVCRVPTREAEDQRRSVREHRRVTSERGATTNRIRSLLVLHGIKVEGAVRSTLEVRALRSPADGG